MRSSQKTRSIFRQTLSWSLPNLVPRVLICGKRWSRGSRTKLFPREESFVSHSFVWFIRDVHAVIATAR